MMKKKLFVLLISLSILSVLLCACSGTAEEQNPEDILPAVIQDTSTIVEGNLVPKEHLYLKFKSSGEILKIMVEEGDEVQKGDVLARMDGTQALEAELQAVELEMTDSTQKLEKLYEYADLANSAAYAELLDAQLAWNIAEQEWDEFDQEKYEDDLDDAKIDVKDAEDDLEDAQENMEDYQELEEDNPTRERYEDELEDTQDEQRQALRDQENLEISFEQLKLNLENAEARLEIAETEYEKVKDGPDEDQLELLESRIHSAEANKAAIETALNHLILIAPFDGTVVDLKMTAGELISAGAPVLLLADFTEWYVETSDLTEMDVVEIAVGQNVVIQPDAMPELEFSGVVESINDFAELRQGDVTYTARILLDEFDENLRWGMTVVVIFEE